MTRSTNGLTLIDVVNTVGQYAETDDELKAVVTYLVNSGRVRLCGSLAGSTVDLPRPPASVSRLEPAAARSRRVWPQPSLNSSILDRANASDHM